MTYSWELEGKLIKITDEDLVAEIGKGPFEILDTEHDCCYEYCREWITSIKEVTTGKIINREIYFDDVALME